MRSGSDPRPGQADLPWHYAAIALLPVFVFLLSEVILLTLAHNDVAFPEPALASTTYFEPGEAAARLKMLGMGFLVFVSCVAVICKFAADLYTYFAGPARQTLYLTYAIVVLIGLVFLAMTYAQGLPLPKERLGEALFDQVFGGLRQGRSMWRAPVYEVFISVTHIAVLLAMAAFVAGGLSCLARLPGLSDTENWKYQSDRLKTYVFLSAAFLAISVLYFKSWADYPAFLLKASDFAAYSALSNAYTSFIGIEYSLMLAALALPIAYLQARKGDAIATRILREAHDTATRSAATLRAQVSAMKKEQGLELSVADILKVVLAIIGPFMTGALTNLASAVG